MFLSQSPHELGQLVLNKSKDVAEDTSIHFSQVDSLLSLVFATIPKVLVQVQEELFAVPQTSPCSTNKI